MIRLSSYRKGMEMFESIDDLVSVVLEELQEKGCVLYSKTMRDVFTVLTMFHPLDKKFVIVVFTNEPPAECLRTQCFLHMAESKAEIFGNHEGSPYMVWRGDQGFWQITTLSEGLASGMIAKAACFVMKKLQTENDE